MRCEPEELISVTNPSLAPPSAVWVGFVVGKSDDEVWPVGPPSAYGLRAVRRFDDHEPLAAQYVGGQVEQVWIVLDEKQLDQTLNLRKPQRLAPETRRLSASIP